MMQRQCSKCYELFTPRVGTGQAAFCSTCEVAQREAVEAAETYQRKLAAGDTSLTPASEDDARRLSRAVTKRRTE